MAPGTPTGLTAAVSGGSVTLRWNAPTTGGAPTGYVLFVGSASGASNLGSFALGAVTTLTSPAPPGQYFVRVVATNACGAATSNQASFVIGAVVAAVASRCRPGTTSARWPITIGSVCPPITSFTLQLGQASADERGHAGDPGKQVAGQSWLCEDDAGFSP